jgi:hypothetical protein
MKEQPLSTGECPGVAVIQRAQVIPRVNDVVLELAWSDGKVTSESFATAMEAYKALERVGKRDMAGELRTT